MPARFVISVFSPHSSSWRWYEPDLQDQVDWLFTNDDIFTTFPPQSLVRRLCRRFAIGRIWGAWRCANQAQQAAANLLVAHDPMSTLWLGLFLRLLGIEIPLITFTCHFEHLPSRYTKWLWCFSFQRVQRFLVHTHLEQHQYAQYFDLPLDRFQLVRWGVNPPNFNPQTPPPLSFPYICSVGKSGRDYRTLLAAMAALPELTLILVAMPHNLKGLKIPANVRVLYNVPEPEYLNILQHSLFLAVPLKHRQTLCGLMTVVTAMLSPKAVLITQADALRDYLPANYPAPQVLPQDVKGWIQSLKRMAADQQLRQHCEHVGEIFAAKHCSHQACLQSCIEIFREFGLEVGKPDVPQPDGQRLEKDLATL